jgi:MFS family permease
MISATGGIVFVTLGGIIGASLTSNLAWATLPVSMVVLATAITTVPAAMLMRRIGRRYGFALSSCSAALAALTAIWALKNGSFLIFLLAGSMFGINLAFTQQYRFAAAESVNEKYVPRAISFVLLGAVGGALIGPEVVTEGQFWIEGVPYAGCFLVLAMLYSVQALLLLLMKPIGAEHEIENQSPGRALAEIVRQPVFIVAVLGGTAGYGLMALVMTATPISMNINDGFSLEITSRVIQAHVLAMYLPSLVSGFLIEKLGVVRMMLVGAVTLIAASVVGLQGHAVLHYWWVLVLLGVGWNFLYVGATTMLTYTYSTAERFRAQGINEFLVFGSSATASLLAGTVMYYFGWFSLMLVPIPILLIVAIALIVVRRNALLDRQNL